MKNIPIKVNNVDILDANEFNPNQNELENAVTTTGQTLDEFNEFQLSESMARYAATGGVFYQDSGSANNYVLAALGSFQAPAGAYLDGMEVVFKAGNDSTAASLINVSNIGDVSLTTPDGSALTDEIVAGEYQTARYSNSNNRFELLSSSGNFVSSSTASVDERLPVYDGTSGRVVKDSGSTIADLILAAGAGDVVGPLSAVDERLATFDGATGKIIQDAGQTINDVVAASAEFPSGTRLVFQQQFAPTGWTKELDPVHNESALRCVSTGAFGFFGGAVEFQTAFASQTPTGSITSFAVDSTNLNLSVNNHSLSVAQLAAHSHNILTEEFNSPGGATNQFLVGGDEDVVKSSEATGSGSGHNHAMSGSTGSHGHSGSASFSGNALNLDVKFSTVIIATKD
ncbi:MAG: hypothetical protein V3U60_16360 [Gammaproteobacteria bacterium]